MKSVHTKLVRFYANKNSDFLWEKASRKYNQPDKIYVEAVKHEWFKVSVISQIIRFLFSRDLK